MNTLRVGAQPATATDRLHRPTLTSRPAPPSPAGAGPRTRRILMLSWEYPPVLVGGLGRHVHALSVALAAAGHEVTVVTRHAEGAPLEEYADGVRIVRAAEDPVTFPLATGSLLAWTMAFNHTLTRAALRAASAGSYDVIHAHDWLVAHPAVALAQFLDVPLVSTIHATEAGRHSGWVSGPVSRQVHALESWLVRDSDSLITCSASMSDEITTLFGPELADISVIPNGIDTDGWPFAPRRPHPGPAELLYFGRLEYEKGVHDAIAALPKVRRTHPGTTLTIAGDGTQMDFLTEQARKHKVVKATNFVGRVDHQELLRLLHQADVAVLPSHYEPFGIVALEAAAAGTPLVTSTAGGLGEAVIDGVTGMSYPPGDVPALAAAIRAVLDSPEAAQDRAAAARARLTSDFAWHTVAAETEQVYLAAKRAVRRPQSRRPIVERPLPGR